MLAVSLDVLPNTSSRQKFKSQTRTHHISQVWARCPSEHHKVLVIYLPNRSTALMCRRTEPSKFVFIITHSYKFLQKFSSYCVCVHLLFCNTLCAKVVISYCNLSSGNPFAIRKDLTNAEYSLSGVHSLFSSSVKTFFIALSLVCSHDRNSLLTDCNLSFLLTTRLLRFKSKMLSVIAPRLLSFLAVIIVPRKIKNSFGLSS